jgi:hypothetical protein
MKLKTIGIALILMMLFISTVSFACYDQNSEFVPNVWLPNSQHNPSVAMVKGSGQYAGFFVIAWMSNQQAGQNGQGNQPSKMDIYARRFDDIGTPLDNVDILINVTTDNFQQYPSVAINESGKIIIAWEEGADKDVGGKIYYRTWSLTGSLGSSEVPVRTATGAHNPSAGIDNNGRFAITWFEGTNTDVFANIYDPSETVLYPLLPVSADATDIEEYPSLDMSGNGNFIVAWQKADDKPGGLSDYGIRAKFYSWSGSNTLSNSSPSLITVNSYNDDNQKYPSASINDSGAFVIVWQSMNQYSAISDFDIYARRYTNPTTPVDPSEFLVNQSTTGKQEEPDVDMDSDNDFVVAWQTNQELYNGTNAKGIRAAEIKWSDTPPNFYKTEFQVNNVIYNEQDLPSVSVNDVYNQCLYVIAWRSSGYNGLDTGQDNGRSHDIAAKLYGPQQEETPTPTPTPPNETETPTPPNETPTPTPNAIGFEFFKAEVKGNNVIMTWKTGTEIDNLGFYIIKSDNVNSGYTLLNDNIIPAQGTSYAGYTYKYIDGNALSGHVYYYWLADMDIYGKYTIHGPVKVITKIEGKIK